MKKPNKIDYTRFKIDVFTPEGVFIKSAPINQEHIFYVSGLVPGNEYDIIFSYDGILLLCASFKCDTKGKVIYLSPAHFLFNNEVLPLSDKVVSELAPLMKKREDLNLSNQLWEKRLIENFVTSGKKSAQQYPWRHRVVRYKAGSELASKVK
jgi:hypothetical protein